MNTTKPGTDQDVIAAADAHNVGSVLQRQNYAKFDIEMHTHNANMTQKEITKITMIQLIVPFLV